MGDAAVRAGQPDGRDDGPAPRVALAAAPARALPGGHRRRCARAAPALGPGAVDVEPDHRAPGRRSIDPDELVKRLANFGYRREELVEHRGEFARRGAIIDVYPSTGDAPVRIDLWGDEVDRLTTFGVNDQRSTADLDEAIVFPARELIPTDDVQARAKRLVAAEPWGREQWERLGRGRAVRRAWRAGCRGSVDDDRAAHRRPARARPRSCWSSRGAAATGPPTCSPRRTTSPRPWPRRGNATPSWPFPACTPSPTGCSPASGSFWSIDSVPESPGDADRRGVGLGPGRRRRRGARAPPQPAARQRATASSSPPTATDRQPGCAACSSTTASTCPSSTRRPTDLTASRRHGSSSRRSITASRSRTPRSPSSPRATSPDGGAPTAVPAPAAATASGSSRTSSRACYVVHFQHGVGQYEGMVKRTIGGVERDYLLLAYKGGDKLYVPSRPDRHAAPVRRRRGADAAPPRRRPTSPRPRAGSGRRCARSPRSSSCSTRSGCTAEGHAFGQRHAVAGRDGGCVPVRRDARPADGHRRREGRHGAGVPDGPPRVRRRRVRQDRGRDPGRVQGDPGRQAGRRARADDAARHPARQTFADRFAGYPIRVEVLSRFLTAAQASDVIDGLALRRGRLRDRHPPPAHRRRRASRTSACSSSTRSSASACSTRRR